MASLRPPRRRLRRGAPPWNLAVDQRPAAVAFPDGLDVQAIVDFARERASASRAGDRPWRLHPRPARDTILVATGHLRGVRIDPKPAAPASAPAPYGGTSPARRGLRARPPGGLGGRRRLVGYRSRRAELARPGARARLHSVIAIELVSAEGRHVRAAPRRPELFWALRGGAAPGIVTALEFELCPVEQPHGGALLSRQSARKSLCRLREWTDNVRTGHEPLPDRQHARPPALVVSRSRSSATPRHRPAARADPTSTPSRR